MVSIKCLWLSIRKNFFKKNRLKITLKLETSNVIPLINRYQIKSFTRVNTNMKAMQSRGQNPMNYTLLKDPGILRTKLKVTDLIMAAFETISTNCFANDKKNNTNDDIDDLPKKDLKLNTSEGYAGQYLGEIFQHEVDCHKLQSKVEKQKTDSKSL